MNNNKIEHKIEAKGSLGLLAHGDIGLRAWRKVKQSKNKNQKKSNEKK